MNKLRGVKNLIITTIIALIVGIFSFLALELINKNNSPKQRPVAATNVDVAALKKKVVKSGYLDIDILITEMEQWGTDLPDNYLSEVLPALVLWLEEVDNTYGVGTAKGMSFIFGSDPGDTNIVLTNNINCSGQHYYPIGFEVDNVAEGKEAISPFIGTFDGRGFTIKNFSITDGFGYYDSRETYAGLLYGCGFFAALSRTAVVKNLRIQNMTINSHYSSIDPAYSGSSIGGIAGVLVGEGSGKATISNCIVDGLTVNCGSSQAERTISIGGILGANPHFGATISNCLVNKISFNGSGKDFATLSSVGGIVGNDPSSGSTIVSVEKCVVNKDKWYLSSAGTGYTAIDITEQQYSNCYSSKSSGFANLGSGLDKGNVSSTWYCVPDFNGGWPYLRDFIDFSAITFDTDDDGYIEGRIYVPTDIKNTVYSNAYSAQNTSSKVVIYGDSVSADTKNGYTFSSWSKGSSINFVANFEADEYTLSFQKPTCNGTVVNSSPSTATVKVKYNQTITISKNLSPTATTITYTIGSTNVVYTLSNIYVVASFGSINSVALKESYKIPDLVDGTTYKITPTVNLKTYNITFN